MSFKIFSHREVGPLACNCYIVGDTDTKQAIVIDPGGDPELIEADIAAADLTITALVATHAHFDHVLAAEAIRAKTGAPFYLHQADKPVLEWLQASGQMFLGIELPPPPDVDTTPSEGDRLVAGGVALQVIHTPGHSPGSISLVAPEALFAGDTLFAGSVGRTDLPGGDTDTLIDAVRNKLFRLDEDLPVYPGHGPATTIAEERRSNPFVGDNARGGWGP
jgi:glyoxylase-like metal-dependent hydrolase (beta-lactamase superfamily II)